MSQRLQPKELDESLSRQFPTFRSSRRLSVGHSVLRVHRAPTGNSQPSSGMRPQERTTEDDPYERQRVTEANYSTSSRSPLVGRCSCRGPTASASLTDHA